MKFVKNTWLPSNDTHFEHYIDNEGNYQKKQFDTVLKYIEPEERGLFIDVGAHIGLWSRMAIKAGFDRILAFEPDINNYNCLVKNLKEFNNNKIFCNYGLSNKSCKKDLIVDKKQNSGANQIIEGNSICVRTFDSMYKLLIYQSLLPFILFKKILIKIDVQGHELEVVEGMTNFIKEYKPIIIVEQWLEGKEDLRATEYCQSLGMKIVDKVNKEIILNY
jgi:FkbM family methyltransferase